MCDEKDISLPWDSFQKPITPIESSDKPQHRDIPQNSWPALPRTVSVMKNKARQRNCHNEGPWGPDTEVQCRVLDWSLNQKEDIPRGTGEIGMCQCSFLNFNK